MGSFDVVISPRAVEQLNKYVDYIQHTLLNNQAAESIWQDAKDTLTALETVAGSLPRCSKESLSRLDYRSILFRKHDYIMIYRIDGTTVCVESVYHLLQDYENIFAKERLGKSK